MKIYITFMDGRGMVGEVTEKQLKSTLRKLRKQFIKDRNMIKIEIVKE